MCSRPGQPEEITHRSLDARFLAAVPVRPNNEFLEVRRALRGNREPDVRDGSRPFWLNSSWVAPARIGQKSLLPPLGS